MLADTREDREVSENFKEIRDTSGTLGEVRNGSWDTRVGPGRVEGLSDRSKSVGGHSGRSGMGWSSLGKVQDGSAKPRGGPGWVR